MIQFKVDHKAVGIGFIQELVVIEKRVTTDEQDALRARWEFGRMLLDRRHGKLLPRGMLDTVAEEVGVSRRELKYRVQFAGRFTTEKELGNAVAQFPSWHQMVRDGLVKAHVPKAKPSAAVTALRAFARVAPDLSAADLTEADWQLIDLIQAEVSRLYDEAANAEGAQSA